MRLKQTVDKVRQRWSLLKDGGERIDRQMCVRLLRSITYKLLKPYFAERHEREASRRASQMGWEKIYTGEKPGLVSVILPVFNQAGFLDMSIQSVLSQKYNNIELIVVNDGSTDGVESVLNKYAGDPRVKIFTQANSKLPAALNTGFHHAKGEFLTWTSADNIMMPHQLGEQVRFLKKRKHVQVVFCNYETIDEMGRPYSQRTQTEAGKNIVDTDEDVRALGYTYNFIAACFMYRRYAARVAGNYDPKAYGAEDYDFWMRLNHDFSIQHIGDHRPYYQYRIHQESIKGREGGKAIGEVIRGVQALDAERGSFFRKPSALFLPKAVLEEIQGLESLSRQQAIKPLAFEGPRDLQKLRLSRPNGMKCLLFLFEAQLTNPDFGQVLMDFKHDRLLFTFGLLRKDTETSLRSSSEMLDWLIVEESRLYDLLSPEWRESSVYTGSWQDCLPIWKTIADHHLFYKKDNRAIVNQFPEHRRYLA